MYLEYCLDTHNNQPVHLHMIKRASIFMFHIKNDKSDNDFASRPSLDMHKTAISNEVLIVIREFWWREFPWTQ